jgi:hypothetical protein
MAQQKAGTAVEPRPVETLIEYLTRRAEVESDSRAYEVAASQLERILSAETEEEFWDATTYVSTGGRDLEDVEQQVLSFSVHRGSDQYQSPLQHFIMVNAARLDTGEQFVWNTGSPLIIGQLRWLESKGKLPKEVVIKGTPTPNGTVLKLRPVPKRATPGQSE